MIDDEFTGVTFPPPPSPRDNRLSFDEWGLALAKTASLRAECTRRRVGAVILDRKTRQTWLGMNGAPPGEPSCLDGACPRGRHYEVVRYTAPPYEAVRPRYYGSVMSTCACGNSIWPCPDSVPRDSSYDTANGTCIAIHAELACLTDAGRANITENAVMYISEKPCPACERIIRGYLKRVVWPDGELNF